MDGDASGDASTASLHTSAACCLGNLLRTLVLMREWSRAHPELTGRAALAATDLAHLLYNGSDCTIAGSCSCCLASGASASSPAPVLSMSRVGSLVTMDFNRCEVPGGALFSTILHRLCLVYTDSITSVHQDAAFRRTAASKGGLLLEAQHLAQLVAQTRDLRAFLLAQRGSSRRRGGGGSGGVPGCADPAAFLGAECAAQLAHVPPPPGLEEEPARLQLQHANSLAALLAAAGAPQCPICTPEQLLLLIEAALGGGTTYPDAGIDGDSMPEVLGAVYRLLPDSCVAWLPGFLQRAAPALSAFVLAAAQQLPTDAFISPAQKAYLATTTVQAAALLMVPAGGALHSLQLPSDAFTPARLLGCAELALRSHPGGRLNPGATLGVHILKVRALAANCS
jgi:hypothetical protein